MTVTRAGHKARSAGRDAASSRWLQWLARGGLVARGAMYLLIGVLAVQIAFGSSGKQADTSGALRAVAMHPGGIVVLWLLAVGFAGLAIWRFAEVAYGQAGPGGRKAGKRLGSLRYVSSQMRHRVLLFPRVPPGTDAAVCHCRRPAC
jgi:hypothetical protein